MTDILAQALAAVADPSVLLVVLGAAVYGTVFGSIPGLSATMAVALVVPLTYFLSPLAALAAVITLEACAISAGDIPSALMRIPGTPASAAYANDLYALAQRGQYYRALGTCVMFSAIGGLFGAVVLIFLAQPFARLATVSTVVEYFWFYVIGLGCAVVVTRGSALKGAFSLLLGLLFSTVGLSAVHTEARFTFGHPELYQGINFIPAMIGLFGLSEGTACGLAARRPRTTHRDGRHPSGERTVASPVARASAPHRPVARRLRRLARAPLASADANAAMQRDRDADRDLAGGRSGHRGVGVLRLLEAAIEAAAGVQVAARSKALPTPARRTTRRSRVRGFPRSSSAFRAIRSRRSCSGS